MAMWLCGNMAMCVAKLSPYPSTYRLPPLPQTEVVRENALAHDLDRAHQILQKIMWNPKTQLFTNITFHKISRHFLKLSTDSFWCRQGKLWSMFRSRMAMGKDGSTLPTMSKPQHARFLCFLFHSYFLTEKQKACPVADDIHFTPQSILDNPGLKSEAERGL